MSARALIINADDLGYDPAVTRGILRAMREGVVSSATFMVNTPFSEAAARDAQGLALGLHFNLARGTPVSASFPRELLDGGELVEAHVASLPVEVVEAEAGAQLARFQALLGRPATHVDVHKHKHLHPNVMAGLIRAVRAAGGVPVRSINDAMRRELTTHGVPTNAHFIGDAGTEAYWTLERFEAAVATLPASGVIELMCHPGYRPEAVRSGYSAQREVELDTFLHPGARRALERAGVTPADFRVLTARP